MQVNNTYGEPGKAPSIRIRGFGTLVSGASEPLYVVDGVPFDGNMAELNSNDIASMSILKMLHQPLYMVTEQLTVLS